APNCCKYCNTDFHEKIIISALAHCYLDVHRDPPQRRAISRFERSLPMSDANARNGAPVTLYRNPKSGHCHRVELMLALLDIPYKTVDLDMKNGAHKAPEYLRISPLGQVPAIEDNGVALSDSN